MIHNVDTLFGKVVKHLLLLFFCLMVFLGQLHAQTLIISSSGETDLPGTNWSRSGTNPVTITVTVGDASISPSVINNYLNNEIDVIIEVPLDIRIADGISKTSGLAAALTFNAGRDIFVQETITSSSSGIILSFNADSDNDNIGAITVSKNLSTNGSPIYFLDDVSFNGSADQQINSGAATIDFGGEVMLSNTSGVTLLTTNEDITFSGVVNSGNSYSLDAIERTWDGAFAAHSSEETYLATITSKMELTAAMAIVPNGGAWLGGSDKQGEGTWKWMTGPEAGRTEFWTTALAQGIKGYSGTNGSYVNWNTGEPNDSGSDEDALQIRNNTDGYWNDLPTTSSTLASVVENELPPSPLIINAGTGDVVFNGSVGEGKALQRVSITAANTVVNGGGVKTDGGEQSYTGNLSIGGSNVVFEMLNTTSSFTLNANKTITGTNTAESTLTIKNPNNILLASGSNITAGTYPLNLILWANTNASADGYVDIKSTSITTNNGDLWMGGGNSNTAWGAHNVGSGSSVSSTSTGLLLDGVSINTGAGAVKLAGKSTCTTAASHGIWINEGAVTSTSGSIVLTGTGGAATGAAANCDGVRIEGSVQSSTGNIYLTGYSATEDQSEGIAVEPTGVLTSSIGNITLRADNIFFATDARATSAGELSISPLTASATIGIAGAAGTLSLPSSRFASNFTDGFSQITIGNGTQSGNINLNTVSFRDNMRLQTSGTVIINATQTVEAQNIKLQIDNNLDMGTDSKIIR